LTDAQKSKVAAARRTKFEQLSLELRHELEWIPLKAMRRECREALVPFYGMHRFIPDHLHLIQDKIRKPGPERLQFQMAFREHRARFDFSSNRGAYLTAEEQKELAL